MFRDLMKDPSITILFVCLGNICRSPLAEAHFIHLLEENQLDEQFKVDSAGTGSWHIGEKADPRMRKTAGLHGIRMDSIGRQFIASDYQKFEYIVAMDKKNRFDILNIAGLGGGNIPKHVFLLRDFDEKKHHGKDVPDPWFGGDSDFENVFSITELCCKNLFDFILQEKSIR